MSDVRVLVVDDDEDLAEALSITMEGRGASVTIAHSGHEALQCFEEDEFDICFMDVMMPGLNGVDCLFEIRRLNPKARIVMMTGHSVEQLLERALDGGAIGVLHKPVAIPELLRLMEDASKGCVLIADDDEDFCEALKLVLEESGKRVICVGDGVSALSIVQREVVDALVLDGRMPGLSGVETYLQMRNAGVDVFTILVTAFEDEGLEADASALQQSRVRSLRKPLDMSQLLNLLSVEATRSASS